MNRWVFLIALSVVVGAWGTGLVVKSFRTPSRRPIVIGFRTWGEWGSGLWKRRAGVVTTAAATVIAVFVAAVVITFLRDRQQRQGITFVGVVGVIGGYMAWDAWRYPDGKPYAEVRAELRQKRALRAAAADVGANPVAVTLRDGKAEVLVDHTSTVDHETVGRAVHAGHTTIEATDQMGRSVIRVHDQAPPPELGEWDAIRARGVLLLPNSLLGRSGRAQLGEDRYGRPHVLPPVVDPEHGRNILLAGVTGTGKSAILTSLQCQLAWQEHVAWVTLDPHRVEFKRFQPRTYEYAAGVEECVETLEWLLSVMRWRLEELDRLDLAEWPMDGSVGPAVLWWLDEFSSLPLKAIQTYVRPLMQEQRKTGMGCVLSIQRPSKEAGMILEVRDNARTRIACGLESKEAGPMLFDVTSDDPMHPMNIPDDLNGAYVLRLKRSLMAGRAYLPSHGPTTKQAVDDFGRQVAAATAHLNVPIA